MTDGVDDTVFVKLGGRKFRASASELRQGKLHILGEEQSEPPPTLTTPPPDEFRPKPATPPIHPPKDPLAPNTLKVIDGDTFDYEGKRFRLFGVDAPEKEEWVWVRDDLRGGMQDEEGHRYRRVSGHHAAKLLMSFMAGKKIEVSPIEGATAGGVGARHRGIARLKIDGMDAGQWLVSQGLAYPVPTYAGTEYDQGFTDAKKGRKGYFSRGEDYFEEPDTWRKQHRRKAYGP